MGEIECYAALGHFIVTKRDITDAGCNSIFIHAHNTEIFSDTVIGTSIAHIQQILEIRETRAFKFVIHLARTKKKSHIKNISTTKIFFNISHIANRNPPPTPFQFE